VDTSKAGCSALAVSISGPSRVELISREVDEGYEFSYTPLAPGDYLITVKYAGTHVPGSPFNAHIEGLYTQLLLIDSFATMALYKFIYLLTYLLTQTKISYVATTLWQFVL